MIPFQRCEDCGSRLDACPAKLRADGERTYVGFYPCQCNEAREEDAARDEWYALEPDSDPFEGERK